MEKKHVFNFNPLLPNIWKRIGLILAVAALITAIVLPNSYTQFTANQKETIKVLTLSFFILGLFLIASSKDKLEDEMTITMRLTSLSSAVFWVTGNLILSPVFYLIIKEPVIYPTSPSLIIQILVWYLIFYYGKKSIR